MFHLIFDAIIVGGVGWGCWKGGKFKQRLEDNHKFNKIPKF